MLPMLEREIVMRHKWATREDMLNYFAISQCIPGIIAVNTATMVGYSERRFWGAVFAAAGVITPSFVIILLIATMLQNIMHVAEAAHAFAGIRTGVAALICAAVIKLFKGNVMDGKRIGPLAFLICIFAFTSVAFFQISPVYVTIAAAALGIVLYSKRGTP